MLLGELHVYLHICIYICQWYESHHRSWHLVVLRSRWLVVLLGTVALAVVPGVLRHGGAVVGLYLHLEKEEEEEEEGVRLATCPCCGGPGKGCWWWRGAGEGPGAGACCCCWEGEVRTDGGTTKMDLQSIEFKITLSKPVRLGDQCCRKSRRRRSPYTPPGGRSRHSRKRSRHSRKRSRNCRKRSRTSRSRSSRSHLRDDYRSRSLWGPVHGGQALV